MLGRLEASFYDYGINSCAPGKQCGHYTQIKSLEEHLPSWAAQLQGVQQELSFPRHHSLEQFRVCDDSPPGTHGGQRPY